VIARFLSPCLAVDLKKQITAIQAVGAELEKAIS
jgi:hypothetical protein|tara:strand:+ start:28 stop:129 length:102 start_codon:yes stop_codon:yes gene_type:complete